MHTPFVIVVFLAAVARARVDYGLFPDTLASCAAPTSLRLCRMHSDLIEFTCESGDDCELTRSRTIEWPPFEPPYNETSTSLFSASLCRSRCRLHSDCEARFGAGVSCVQDGEAEGFVFVGSFCARRVANVTQARAECDDGNAGTVDLAVELGEAYQWPSVTDLVSGTEDALGAFGVFTPCWNESSTTCVCIHQCTTLNTNGCAPVGSVTQYGYMSPESTFVGADGGSVVIVASDLHCPDGSRPLATDDLVMPLCEPRCSVETAVQYTCAADEEPPSLNCGVQTWMNTTVLELVDPDDWVEATYANFMCFNCSTDSQCTRDAREALCAQPPPLLPPFDEPPFENEFYVSGFCVELCVTAAMNEALAAPECVPARVAFECETDDDCAGGGAETRCEQQFSVCTVRGPSEEWACETNEECAVEMNTLAGAAPVALFGAVCVQGSCAYACGNSSENTAVCAEYYDVLKTPADRVECIPTALLVDDDDDSVQHICRLACDQITPPTSSKNGSSVALLVSLSVLGVLFIVMAIVLAVHLKRVQLRKMFGERMYSERAMAFAHVKMK